MREIFFQGRKVLISSLEFEFGKEPEESYISFAYWEDSEERMCDDDLDELTKQCADLVHEKWHEHKVCEAEYLADQDR